MNNEKECRVNDYEKLKCIWMASQIIEYKLCDNKFDCENCVFDRVMRNMMKKNESKDYTVTNIVDTISEKLRKIEYDDNIIYLKNNLTAKKICTNTFYLGVNPILSCFLDNESSITVSNREKNVRIGQQIIRISGVWGSVSLSSPMNFIVYDKIANTHDQPSNSPWHAIIGFENQERFKGKFTPEEWDDKYERALNIIEEIKSEVTKNGCTMLDGGSQIKDLHQLIGNKKYVIILNILST